MTPDLNDYEFWARVTVGHESDCWPWEGYRSSRGYGQLSVKGKTRKAHRVAYEMAIGPIPDGMFVCHRCDNPPCVNPAHLFAGTAADNNRDRHAKGRTVLPYKTPKDQRPHGTPARYRGGCRCAECRNADRDRQTAQRRAQGMKPIKLRADQPHGTRSRYRSGCRCDSCRQAESARKYATRRGLPHAAAK